MSAQLSVATLQAAGFRLSVNGDKLHVEPVPSPDMFARLKAAKPQLLAELRRETLTDDATEYVAERTAICAADGLPLAMLRPVYRCTLRDNPPFTLLGRVGETLEQARTELRQQFGSDFVALELRQSGGKQ